MKKFLLIPLILILNSCIFNWGTNEDDGGFMNYSQYKPIVLSSDAFDNSIQISSPIAMEKTGKIYLYDETIFVGEGTEGFHLVNNSDPTQPTITKFLEVPGSTDMARKGNIIYVNQATDLVAINYNENNQTVQVTKRVQNVFPSLISPDGFEYYPMGDSVVVGWELINN